MTTECPICVSSYTCKKRKAISCPLCDFQSCTLCVKTFIMMRQAVGAQCMNCFGPWSIDFLMENLPRAWVEGAFQEQQENFLLEQQMAILPLDMPLFAFYQNKVKTKKAFEAAKKEVQDGNLFWNADAREHLEVLEVAALQAQKNWQIEVKLLGSTKHPHIVTTRSCPVSTCRGFLDAKWRCYICYTQVCRDCLSQETKFPHVCARENLDTARLLEMETKPCPGCGISVFKIDGCSQMFCVQCKTPFSWTTGELIHGAFHNPHFQDYMSYASEEEKLEWKTRFQTDGKSRYDFHISLESGDFVTMTCKDIEFLAERAFQLSSFQNGVQYFTCLLSVLGFWKQSAETIAQDDDTYLRSKKRQFRLEYLNHEKSKLEWQRGLHRVMKVSRRKMALHHIYLSSCRETIKLVTQLLQCANENWETIFTKLKVVYMQYNSKIQKYNSWFRGKQLYLTSSFEFA